MAKEKESTSAILEKDAALSKSADKIKTMMKEFVETKKGLEKEAVNRDNELSELKMDFKGKIATFTEEKIQLERTISLNIDVTKQEKMNLEKQYNDDLTKVK